MALPLPHPRHPEVPLEGDGEDQTGLASALPASGGSPAEQAVRTEQNSAVRSAVSALPDDLREAIVFNDNYSSPLTTIKIPHWVAAIECPRALGGGA